MTTDERIARLTERHEALTQTVDLMVAENRERDRKWEANWREWDEILGRLTGNVETLAALVAVHERRLNDLEQRG